LRRGPRLPLHRKKSLDLVRMLMLRTSNPNQSYIFRSHVAFFVPGGSEQTEACRHSCAAGVLLNMLHIIRRALETTLYVSVFNEVVWGRLDWEIVMQCWVALRVRAVPFCVRTARKLSQLSFRKVLPLKVVTKLWFLGIVLETTIHV
jgi:hypothetical protein